MKPLNRGYVAGLLDGEGYMGIVRLKLKTRPSTHYLVSLQVNMCNRNIPYAMKNQFGGSVNLQHPETERERPTYRWGIGSQKALAVIKYALPFLVIKRQQAKLCIEMLKLTRSTKGGRKRYNQEKADSLYWDCRKLNRRGTNQSGR